MALTDIKLYLHQVGSVDPARDFRALIKQKNLSFGESETLFCCFWPMNIFWFLYKMSYLMLGACNCVYLWLCDPGVLSSLPATDTQDRAVA